MWRWGLSILWMIAGVARGAEHLAPARFYIVSGTFTDYGPSYDRVIEVNPDGPDTHVRYSWISTVNAYCPRTVIRSAEATLHNVSPERFTKASNPCAVKPGALEKLLKKYALPRVVLLEGTSFDIVAQCGASSAVIRLPFVQGIDMKRLRSAHPEIAGLFGLSSEVSRSAFGPKDILLDPSEADDLVFQRDGARYVPELVSGKYDAGLAAPATGYAGNGPSFRSVLADYRGPVSAEEAKTTYIPQLVNAEAYRFTQFAPPKYPTPGLQTGIEGAVQLQLTVEPTTGEVLTVEALSGNPVLKPSAIEAAKQWRFAPDSGVARTIKLTVDFALRCR